LAFPVQIGYQSACLSPSISASFQTFHLRWCRHFPHSLRRWRLHGLRLSVERAARQHEQAVVAEKDAFITELKDLIAKLEGQLGQYRHAKFGPKSEKLDPAQLALALEDLETAIAETQAQIAAVEEKIAASATDPNKAAPRKERKARALPEHLPRVERVIEPESIACPCGCGDMVRIGEDRTERLDYIPAHYQVIVSIRPKYACPKGRTGVVQAKAPTHLLEGSWPTEALLAQIAVVSRMWWKFSGGDLRALGFGPDQATRSRVIGSMG